MVHFAVIIAVNIHKTLQTKHVLGSKNNSMFSGKESVLLVRSFATLFLTVFSFFSTSLAPTIIMDNGNFYSGHLCQTSTDISSRYGKFSEHKKS